MEKLCKNLRGKEVVEAATTICSAMQNYANDDRIKELLDKIAEMRDKIVEVSYSTVTPFNIEEYSSEIDRCFLMIKRLTEALTLSSNDDTRALAAKVSAILAQHKKFTHQSRLEKIAAVRMMVQDLYGDDLKASVESVSYLTEAINEMTAAADAMETQRNTVLIDRTNQKPDILMVDAKHQLLNLINGELSVAITSAAYNDPDNFKAQLTAVEAIIKHYNDLFRSRRKKTTSDTTPETNV